MEERPGKTKISYLFKAQYPSIQILEFYRHQLGDGWKECRAGDGGWDSIPSGTTDRPTTIHRISRWFLNYQIEEILTLEFQYVSSRTQIGKGPDNDTQEVNLYASKQKELKKYFEILFGASSIMKCE